MIIANLGATPAVLQLPIGAEDTFAGIVDLVTMKAITWNGEELGASFDIVDIPEDLKEQAQEYREKLIELAVEQDEVVSTLLDLTEGWELRDAETCSGTKSSGMLRTVQGLKSCHVGGRRQFQAVNMAL